MKIKKIYSHDLPKKEAERKILRAIRLFFGNSFDLTDMDGKLCVKGGLLCTPYGTGGDPECRTIIIWVEIRAGLIVLDLVSPIMSFDSRVSLENLLDSSVSASLDDDQ